MQHKLPTSPALFPVLAALAVVACDDPASVSLEVTTGHESGVLAEDPAVAEITIVGESADGEVKREATATIGGSFDLGEVPDTAIMTFELTGRTTDGTVIARGRSVSIPIGAVDADVLSLFIQRHDRFARPPGELLRSHVHAPGGILAERFLIVTGGESAAGASGPADPAFGDYYDMLSLAGSESPSPLPIAARSLVVRGTRLFLINETEAQVVDVQSDTQGVPVEAPDGMTFADVAGGLSLELPTGTTLVVGATRPGIPTASVLTVDSEGVVGGISLSVPRAGAAAAYVEGTGLVIAGGSADGVGIEVIKDDLSVVTYPFAPDATTGSALLPLGDKRFALVGGRLAGAAAPSRGFQALENCLQACAPEALMNADVSAIASRGRSFNLASGGAVVLGDADSGETLAFRVSIGEGTVVPLPFREPRFGATPIPAPNGTLAVVGGLTDVGAPVRSIETFFPE